MLYFANMFFAVYRKEKFAHIDLILFEYFRQYQFSVNALMVFLLLNYTVLQKLLIFISYYNDLYVKLNKCHSWGGLNSKIV